MKSVLTSAGCIALLLASTGLSAAPMQVPPVQNVLLPHRAVYTIGLESSTPGSGVTSAAGQMVFELSGSRCTGYSMRQRLIVNLGDEEGNNGLLDFQISTFESGTGDLFRFTSRTTMDDTVVEDIAGTAKRTGSDVEVKLDVPDDTTVKLAKATLFPGQHLQTILDAARADKRFVAAEIYEGAGSGEAADDATAVIGSAGLKPSGYPTMDGVRSWPVSVGYFSESRPAALPGLSEETPSYQMSFTLYENGITNNLVMNYGKYALSGTLTKIEPLSPERCN